MFKEIDRKNINWVSVAIKVVIFLLVLFFICWLVFKIFLKKDNKDIMVSNLNAMRDASVEYFTDDKLPVSTDKPARVILKDLIKEDLLNNLTGEDKKTCDTKKSYSEVTKMEGDEYTLYVYVKCGSDNKYLYETITATGEVTETEPEKTPVVEGPTKKEKDEHEGQKFYYEYAKITYSYGSWTEGTVTGSGVENKTESTKYSSYCKNPRVSYYNATYITANRTNYTYKYTLQLLNIPSSATSVSLQGGYFTSSNDYQAWLSSPDKNLSSVSNSISNATNSLTSSNMFQSCSLKSSNFSYSVSQPYKSGNGYYTQVTINARNASGVTPFYASRLGTKIYFVPIHLSGQYIDTSYCITDRTDRAANYSGYIAVSSWDQKINYYRYITKSIDKGNTKWSTEKSLDGYEATGNTKWE